MKIQTIEDFHGNQDHQKQPLILIVKTPKPSETVDSNEKVSDSSLPKKNHPSKQKKEITEKSNKDKKHKKKVDHLSADSINYSVKITLNVPKGSSYSIDADPDTTDCLESGNTLSIDNDYRPPAKQLFTGYKEAPPLMYLDKTKKNQLKNENFREIKATKRKELSTIIQRLDHFVSTFLSTEEDIVLGKRKVVTLENEVNAIKEVSEKVKNTEFKVRHYIQTYHLTYYQEEIFKTRFKEIMAKYVTFEIQLLKIIEEKMKSLKRPLPKKACLFVVEEIVQKKVTKKQQKIPLRGRNVGAYTKIMGKRKEEELWETEMRRKSRDDDGENQELSDICTTQGETENSILPPKNSRGRPH